MLSQVKLFPPDSVQLAYTKRMLHALPLHDPRYHAILFTNTLPTTLERVWAFDQCEEVSERLETLEEELLLLATFTSSGDPEPQVNISKGGVAYRYSQYLEAERVDTIAFLERVHWVVSPFRRLDDDTLRLVFLFVFADQSAHSVDPLDEDSKSIQWRLASVCRAWWNLAFSIPQFWADIELDFAGAKLLHLPSEKRLAHISKLLYHSYPRPLSISVYCNDPSQPANDLPEDRIELKDQPVLRLFIQQSHRWQHLTVNGEAYIALMNIPELRGQLPSLESVLITGNLTEKRDGAATACDVLQFAPNLRSVDAEGPGIVLSEYQIPFHQLTYIGASESGMLGESPNLVRARIKITKTQPMQVVLPHLQELTITGIIHPRTLITPSLRTLHISIGNVQSIPIDRASLTRLKSLHVSDGHDYGTPPASLIACLHQMPELKALSLSELGDAIEPICVALTPVPGKPVLCPKLESLNIKNGWLTIFPAMGACFERRGEAYANSAWSGSFSPLKTVKLWGVYPRKEKQQLEALLELESPKIEY